MSETSMDGAPKCMWLGPLEGLYLALHGGKHISLCVYKCVYTNGNQADGGDGLRVGRELYVSTFIYMEIQCKYQANGMASCQQNWFHCW